MIKINVGEIIFDFGGLVLFYVSILDYVMKFSLFVKDFDEWNLRLGEDIGKRGVVCLNCERESW